jgi:hypothetical protein
VTLCVRFQTVKAYEPSENFRPSANPLVLLVFRQAHHNQRKIALPGGGEPLFDLTRFMIDNELEHGAQTHAVVDKQTRQ